MAEDSEDQDPPTPMSVAERAAAAGDYATAERLLAATAERQLARLGPLHPELANTLNNLGVVYEINKKPAEAERCFRQAFQIAQAALPPDHPFVATSRTNLEDFCRTNGIPFELPAEPVAPPRASTSEAEAAPPRRMPPVSPTDPAPTEEPSRQTPEPAPRRVPVVAVAALAVLVIIVIAVIALRNDQTPRPAETTPPVRPAPTGASRDTPPTAVTPAPTAEEPQPQSAQAPPAAPAESRAPASSPPPTKPLQEARHVGARPRGTESPTVDAAQLCRELSTSGAWRCVPAASPVGPGALYFYSRVKSPRDTSVEHRWYLGDRLRRSVTLQIRANMFAGYRTYSRQTVSERGRWRVEVRSSDGTVLHEEQFDVE